VKLYESDRTKLPVTVAACPKRPEDDWRREGGYATCRQRPPSLPRLTATAMLVDRGLVIFSPASTEDRTEMTVSVVATGTERGPTKDMGKETGEMGEMAEMAEMAETTATIGGMGRVGTPHPLLGPFGPSETWRGEVCGSQIADGMRLHVGEEGGGNPRAHARGWAGMRPLAQRELGRRGLLMGMIWGWTPRSGRRNRSGWIGIGTATTTKERW
jgi:hypothetical protein